MNIEKTNIFGAYLIKPAIHEDSRGTFMENWNVRLLSNAVGKKISFVQQNYSKSDMNVLKLSRCVFYKTFSNLNIFFVLLPK